MNVDISVDIDIDVVLGVDVNVDRFYKRHIFKESKRNSSASCA